MDSISEINIEDGDINISVSIGIASSDKGKTFTELYRYADIALYNAKKSGKNQFAVYE